MTSSERHRIRRLCEGVLKARHVVELQRLYDDAETLLRAIKRHSDPKAGRRIAARNATRSVYELVAARAGNRCEACGDTPAWGRQLEMDHFLGGHGRRRAMTTAENCWMLCGMCHAMKTENMPSREAWINTYEQHRARGQSI